MFLAHIGIGIGQCHTHAFSVNFIGTEHNGFRHTVCTFQIVGYFLRNFPNSVFYNNVVIIVAIVIDAVFYLVSVHILLSLCRSPLITDVRCDVDYLKRSKEAIFYAIFETISIYWLAKVTNTRLVLGLFWCGSHTDMSSRRKVFQYVSPVAIILCAASMTLVNNNEVKVVGIREQLLIILGIILANQLLVEGKEHLIRT